MCIDISWHLLRYLYINIKKKCKRFLSFVKHTKTVFGNRIKKVFPSTFKTCTTIQGRKEYKGRQTLSIPARAARLVYLYNCLMEPRFIKKMQITKIRTKFYKRCCYSALEEWWWSLFGPGERHDDNKLNRTVLFLQK